MKHNFDGLSSSLLRHACCQYCSVTATAPPESKSTALTRPANSNNKDSIDIDKDSDTKVKIIRLKKCTSCRQVVYCSASCQRLDWVRHHKQYCGHLHALQKSISSLASTRKFDVRDFVQSTASRDLYIQLNGKLIHTLMLMRTFSSNCTLQFWQGLLDQALELLRLDPGDAANLRKLVPWMLLWLGKSQDLREFCVYWHFWETLYYQRFGGQRDNENNNNNNNNNRPDQWIQNNQNFSFHRFLETQPRHYMRNVQAKPGEWIYSLDTNKTNENRNGNLQQGLQPLLLNLSNYMQLNTVDAGDNNNIEGDNSPLSLYLSLPLFLDNLSHSTAHTWRHAKYHYWRRAHYRNSHYGQHHSSSSSNIWLPCELHRNIGYFVFGYQHYGNGSDTSKCATTHQKQFIMMQTQWRQIMKMYPELVFYLRRVKGQGHNCFQLEASNNRTNQDDLLYMLPHAYRVWNCIPGAWQWLENKTLD